MPNKSNFRKDGLFDLTEGVAHRGGDAMEAGV